jgi:hypothetical protein
MTTAGDDVQVRNKEAINRHWEDIWNQGKLDLISTYHASDSPSGLRVSQAPAPHTNCSSSD